MNCIRVRDEKKENGKKKSKINVFFYTIYINPLYAHTKFEDRHSSQLRQLWRIFLLKTKKTVEIKEIMSMRMLILSYTMIIPNIKVIGRVVPEKSLTEKVNTQTHAHIDKHCNGKDITYIVIYEL